MIHLLKNYTLMIVNVNCSEYRWCEIFHVAFYTIIAIHFIKYCRNFYDKSDDIYYQIYYKQ